MSKMVLVPAQRIPPRALQRLREDCHRLTDTNTDGDGHLISEVTTHWMDPDGPNYGVLDYVEKSFRSAADLYGFDLWEEVPIEPWQFNHYEGGGYYGWHVDVDEPLSDNNRKITCVIVLTGPDEYKGGALELMSEEHKVVSLRPEAGTLIFFPSFMLHRVAVVISGVRESLSTCALGPMFR